MKRSICLVEPKYAIAGELGNWKFTYISPTAIPEKAQLKLSLGTRGKEEEWAPPETSLKRKKNILWAEIGKTRVEAQQSVSDNLEIEYTFIVPQKVKAEEPIYFYLGAADQKTIEHGTRAPHFIQRKKIIHLYIDQKGKGQFKETETFYIDIRGNKLDNITTIAPSLIGKNDRFDVIVRFEDKYGNLTNRCSEETMIELSYTQLRENLNWKLFVPETGFLSLPNLYFNKPDIYNFELKNLKTGDSYTSPPMKCVEVIKDKIFWGNLHGESQRQNALENIESCLRFFRDDQSLDYFASSTPEFEEESTNAIWKSIGSHIAEFNEDERFVTFLGFSWYNNASNDGMRHILYAKDNKPLLRSKESKSNSILKVYHNFNPKELISIPTFTMGKGYSTNLLETNPDFERVAEIYNAWGSSECLEKEGNPKPITTTSRKGIKEAKEGSVRNALNQNVRLGFVAGGLDDRGIYGELYESDQVQYTPGMTAILSPNHSRDALFTALYNRHCYATTGEKIILVFNIANIQMGSEISLGKKPGLRFNRHIHGSVAGSDKIKEFTIFRNGKVFHQEKNKPAHFDFAIDDESLFEETALNNNGTFIYYYLRIIQANGHMAWSSPIWIDK